MYEKTKISIETSFLKTSSWLPNSSFIFKTLRERSATLLLCVFMKIQLKTSKSPTRDLIRQCELLLHYLKTSTRGLRSSLTSDQTSANTFFTSRWWAQRSKCLALCTCKRVGGFKITPENGEDVLFSYFSDHVI